MFLLVTQLTPVFAQQTIADCGAGVSNLSINGLNQSLNFGATSHQISITFDSKNPYSAYYLGLATEGKSTIYTDEIVASRIGSTQRYTATFIINDPNALSAFSATDPRTFDATFFAKRTAWFDKLCDIGSYSVQAETVDQNNPEHYCGNYDDRTSECVSIDGTRYSSTQLDLCDGSANANSQYDCCAKNFLSVTNNVCPSAPISGCGTWQGTACRDEVGKYITNPEACATNSTTCCSADALPSSCTLTTPTPTPTPTPVLTPVSNCGTTQAIGSNTVCKIGTELLSSGQYSSCPLVQGECCRTSAQCTAPVPIADKCGDVVFSNGQSLCKVGTTNNTNFQICSNNALKCCLQPGGTTSCNALYPPTTGGGDNQGGGDEGGGNDSNLDGGLTQGPTVADFEALNPLKGSSQAVRLSTPGGIVTRFLQFAFPIAGLILFAMLSWAGFEILTGATNQKSLDAGKQRATAAIVGFLLLFASYWLMQIVEVIFGISVL